MIENVAVTLLDCFPCNFQKGHQQPPNRKECNNKSAWSLVSPRTVTMLFLRLSSILQQSHHAVRFTRSTKSTQSLARFLSSLAILEQRDGRLQSASLSSITAAQKVGGAITGIVAGSSIKKVAEQAARIKGVDKILMVENVAYDKVLHL